MLTSKEEVIFGAVLGFVIVIGSLTYILVVWVNYRDRKLRQNIANIFLYNLLTIDMANLLLVMPFSLSSINGKWKFSKEWAKVNAFLGTYFELASVLALAIISLDRLAAVMKPFLYRARVTRCKAVLVTVLTWCQASVFSLVPVPLGWYEFNKRYMSCTFKSQINEMSFDIFFIILMVCNCLFSLIIIIGTYWYIFRVARSHRKKIAIAIIPGIFNNVKDKVNYESTRLREIRTACKIMIVIGTFIVCHLPYLSIRLLELSMYSIDNVAYNITVATKWLSFSKSGLDPFIYFLLQKKFRKSFAKLLSRRTRRSNRVSERSHVTRSTWNAPIESLGVDLESMQSTTIAYITR